MGRFDGCDDRRTALCLRWRHNSALAELAGRRHEPGISFRIHDYGAGHEDHEPWRTENRHGMETLWSVPCVRDGFLLSLRTYCKCNIGLIYKRPPVIAVCHRRPFTCKLQNKLTGLL